MDVAFDDPDKNYQVAESLIEKATKETPDIIVLPELWTTGYDLTRLGEIADKDARQTPEFLKRAAKKYKVDFVGGSVARSRRKRCKKHFVSHNERGKACPSI